MINLTELLSKQESEILEFKEAKQSFNADKLGQYFSALSNEANLFGKKEAYLLFGIRNDKTIVGTKINDNAINNYKLEISKNISPSINFKRVERINTKQGDVICFVIPAAHKGIPTAWKNLYYGRDGESLGGLNINEIERILDENQNKDWSIEIIPDATINDLSQEAINFARIQFSEKNPHLKEDIKNWDDTTFLNKAKITINGKITRTSILLLGKPESDYLLTPSTSRITWILKDKDGIEKDYEHFTCPLLLNIQNVYSKIRNIKYRYIRDESLFPEEVLQYDPYIIREALNNCIAHQDYTMGGKIILVEKENDELIFTNSGDFIPVTIENVLASDAPETIYRNAFLANAMVNLNMIDTIGSGIKKMFNLQKNKYFPLPEYDFSNHKVKLTITGKVLDLNYARKLAANKDLSLFDIILLDKVQKHKKLSNEEFKTLKDKKLIEGRKNNYIISSTIAKITNQETDYTKLKGVSDKFYKELITEYLSKFGTAIRADIEKLLFDKLPESLSNTQKKNKVKNLLQSLKNAGDIEVNNNNWTLSKHK